VPRAPAKVAITNSLVGLVLKSRATAKRAIIPAPTKPASVPRIEGRY
jgi:hypothetical protein